MHGSAVDAGVSGRLTGLTVLHAVTVLLHMLPQLMRPHTAATAAGSCRAGLQLTGDLTVGTVLTMLPYANAVAIFTVKGTALIEAARNGFSAYPTGGRFLQVLLCCCCCCCRSQRQAKFAGVLHESVVCPGIYARRPPNVSPGLPAAAAAAALPHLLHRLPACVSSTVRGRSSQLCLQNPTAPQLLSSLMKSTPSWPQTTFCKEVMALACSRMQRCCCRLDCPMLLKSLKTSSCSLKG